MCSDTSNRVASGQTESPPRKAKRARVSGCGAMHCAASTGSPGQHPSTRGGSGAVDRSNAPLRRQCSISLLLVDLVEVVKTLRNKAQTHNRLATDSTESLSPDSMPGFSGPRGTPNPAHHAPDNPRAGESTSGNLTPPVGVGAGVPRLRVGTRLPATPGPILSDHAVATWLHPAPFGCDNPPACQPAPSVQPGGDVGDRGVGKKVGDMRSDHPLHVHIGHQLASPTC